MDAALIGGRGVAELRTDPDTANGQFEVDWELAEVMVGWSEEAIPHARFGVSCQARHDAMR